MTDFFAHVEARRRENYRQSGEPTIHTMDEALDFIDEVGFCLLFPHDRIELPNLSAACSVEIGPLWRWKDELPARGRVYYGKCFHKKPGFVALHLMPALYALSPIAEEGNFIPGLFERGVLTIEAKRIGEVLADHGPLPTRELRQEVGLTGKANKYRFSRSLAEAESHFLIVKVGMTSSTRAHYSYIWDAFEHSLPKVVDEGLRLKPRDAAATVITRYVKTVVAASPIMVARLFTLSEVLVEEVAALLEQDGTLARNSNMLFDPAQVGED